MRGKERERATMKISILMLRNYPACSEEIAVYNLHSLMVSLGIVNPLELLEMKNDRFFF